ncbi:MAG TPA: hypothetical protein DD687_05765 [Verrucomicrobiales bacterium]|nr:hypothetical protein [Verrucomicrobiales bacterium]
MDLNICIRDFPRFYWRGILILCMSFSIRGDTSVLGSTVDFNHDIRPILSEHCFPCHGPDRNHRKGGLRLDQPDVLTKADEGDSIILPGSAGKSPLIQRVLSHDPDEVMPPPDALLELNPSQKDILVQWVNEGAHWDTHWSFVPPVERTLPEVNMRSWSRHVIDFFVLEQLESMEQFPSREADPLTLLRRLSFDLTGMPPEPDEVGSLEENVSDVAYDAWVERLLASPRFGERMALPWLDAARYADTNGYQNDGDREMWRWRDWVVEAFNSNMPFDQFTIEQLAGDLLAESTLEQKIATGFNRNHRYNSEGGSIPQEVLTENVADRVETTSTTWLGLTMGCARCHDHKYDPITTEDYYGMFSFFHNVPETGRAIRDGNSEPYIKAPTWLQQEKLQQLERAVRQAGNEVNALQPLIDEALEAWHQGGQWRDQKLSLVDEGLIHARSFENSLAGWDAVPLREQPEHGRLEWTAAIQGTGVILNGTWDGNCGDIGRFTNMTPYSFSLWVKPTRDHSGAIFSRIQDGVDGKGYQLVYEKGHFRYLSISQGYAGRIGVRTFNSFQPGQWYHLTVTYDATMSARGIKIFVNGEKADVELLRNNDSNPSGISSNPLLLGRSAMAGEFEGALDEFRVYDRVLTSEEISALSEPVSVQDLLVREKNSWTPRQLHVVRTMFKSLTEDPRIRPALLQWHEAQKQLSACKQTLPTVMVMEEMEAPRPTHILLRGQYDQPGKAVDPAVPGFISKWNEDYPANRLGLAQWLVSDSHPLTARVFVNRVWQMLFGQGLVETAEDFGVQGASPTHLELLDWLAVDFIKSGWDVKRLVKSIVTSATYRQQSDVSPEMLEWDPENKWLARGPQKRLPAHFVRDQLLELSGLKVDIIGGPPVFPYQPDDLWGEVSRKTYPESKDAGRYRRSLYTYFKRTVAPPLMQTFDAADRESCIVRQQTTNTPLQALAMLNAPILLEAAWELAKAAWESTSRTPESQVQFLFENVLLRTPSEREYALLSESFLGYQSMTGKEQESIMIELGKPRIKVSNDLFPGFCISLTLLGLDETLTSR